MMLKMMIKIDNDDGDDDDDVDDVDKDWVDGGGDINEDEDFDVDEGYIRCYWCRWRRF